MELNNCELVIAETHSSNAIEIDKDGNISSRIKGINAFLNVNGKIAMEQSKERMTNASSAKWKNSMTTLVDLLSPKIERLKGEDISLYHAVGEFLSKESGQKKITSIATTILEPLFTGTKIDGENVRNINAPQMFVDYLVAKRTIDLVGEDAAVVENFKDLGLYNFTSWDNEIMKEIQLGEEGAVDGYENLTLEERKQAYYRSLKQYVEELDSAMSQGKFKDVRESLSRLESFNRSLNIEYAREYEEFTGNDILETNLYKEHYVPIIVKHGDTYSALGTARDVREFKDNWKKTEGSNKNVVLDPRILIYESIRNKVEGLNPP